MLNLSLQACTGKAFYTFDAFVKAAAAFPSFAGSPSDDVNRRELAAFLGQISHEVTGAC